MEAEVKRDRDFTEEIVRRGGLKYSGEHMTSVTALVPCFFSHIIIHIKVVSLIGIWAVH